jgi:O-methyltransferase
MPSIKYKLNRNRGMIQAVLSKNITYLTEDKLHLLAYFSQKADVACVEGVFVEVGCALGGSTIVLAKSKAISRRLLVYDTFGMIPPPSPLDPPAVHKRYSEIESGCSPGIGGEMYYGYRSNLYDEVKLNMKTFGCDALENNVSLVKGLIQDSLHLDTPVALAHIDADWYESVSCALNRLVPHLAPSGTLIIDDYYYYEGCKNATDEFFWKQSEKFSLQKVAGSMVVRRKKQPFWIFWK